MTMSQLTALDTGDDSDDEDRQTYYAGGAKGRCVFPSKSLRSLPRLLVTFVWSRF